MEKEISDKLNTVIASPFSFNKLKYECFSDL